MGKAFRFAYAILLMSVTGALAASFAWVATHSLVVSTIAFAAGSLLLLWLASDWT